MEASRDFARFGVLLPSQHFRPSNRETPERRLMVAVLLEALECLGKYRTAADPKGRRIFAEARQWFLAEQADWPYSFAAICAVLDLDSDAVLDRLLADRLDAAPCQAMLEGAG